MSIPEIGIPRFLSAPFSGISHRRGDAKKEEEEDTINPAVSEIQQQLHSLLDSISRVEILKGKWSLITTKLTSLHHRLSDLFTTAANNNNPLSSNHLRSISATCSSAASLSLLCHSPTRCQRSSTPTPTISK
ncbi:hypothetical protein SASPL_140452 [Salvia splendens]|uniref:DUF7032 domain-containing protein n=1 Tax=Salvia splendens TaxID=180675 RepID=A0A8X8WQC3_SALSN|nr:hypothetical protein SASPL_140452 [Salvia splendens]